MKLDEIKSELKGYFIYRENHQRELALKQGKDYELIVKDITYRNFKDTYYLRPLEYLRIQIQNNLLDPTAIINSADEVIPVVDFDIFSQYDKRNNEIKHHKELLDEIQGSKSIFGKKKDYKLLHIAGGRISEEQYFIVKNNEVVPVDIALIDDNTDNAVEVVDISEVKKALADDMQNQYSEKYREQCRIWESI